MKECTTEVYGKLKSGVIDFYYASKRPNDSEYETILLTIDKESLFVEMDEFVAAAFVPL